MFTQKGSKDKHSFSQIPHLSHMDYSFRDLFSKNNYAVRTKVFLSDSTVTERQKKIKDEIFVAEFRISMQ